MALRTGALEGSITGRNVPGTDNTAIGEGDLLLEEKPAHMTYISKSLILRKHTEKMANGICCSSELGTEMSKYISGWSTVRL